MYKFIQACAYTINRQCASSTGSCHSSRLNCKGQAIRLTSHTPPNSPSEKVALKVASYVIQPQYCIHRIVYYGYLYRKVSDTHNTPSGHFST